MCIRNNSAFGMQKKYFPEMFAINPYARPTPTVNQLYL